MPYRYHHRHRGHRSRYGPHFDRPYRPQMPFDMPSFPVGGMYPYMGGSPMMGPMGPPPPPPPPPCGMGNGPGPHSTERGGCGERCSSRGPSPPPGDFRGPWGHGPWGYGPWGMAPPPHWGMPHPPMHWGPFGRPEFGHHGPWGRGGRHGGGPAFPMGGPGSAVQSPSVPVLTYFDIQGLAEPIRLLLTAGHIPFEDRRITIEEWASRFKNYSPLKQVPILEVDGQTIVQSHAILQYAATRAGFWPSDEHQQLAAANITALIDEARRKMQPEAASDPLTAPEKMAELAKTVMPPLLRELETLIAEGGHRYSVGPHLTYVDFVVAQVIEDAKSKGIETEEFKKLNEIHRGVYDLPPIRRYRMDRKTPSKPIIYDSNAWGLSMVAKWCLSVGEVEYEEVIMTTEEIEQKKAENPKFDLPYIEVDGKQYRGQMGMIAYAASRADLIPDDVLEVAGAWAITRSLENSFFFIYDALIEGDQQKLKSLITEKFVPYIKNVDPLVGENQDAEGHVVSNSLTFADLYVAMVYLSLRTHLGCYLDGLELPAMRRTYNMVMNIEAIRTYEYTKSRLDLTITYPEHSTKADAIKKLLELGNIKYIDRPVTSQEWNDVYSKNAPTGEAPYMEVDGHLIGGVRGCLTYAAERTGLVPPIYLGRAQAEMIYSSWAKVALELAPLEELQAANATATDYTAKAKEIREERMPSVLALFEKLIRATQHPAGYLVNNQLTYIDVYIGAEFNALLVNNQHQVVPENYSEVYPNITKVWSLVNNKIAN